MDKAWRRAAVEGDADLMERLLAEGEAVDSRDRYGQTALMLAAVHGHAAVIDLLVARGADLDVTGKYGLSALMLAVVNAHAEIALTLIEAGANTGLRGTGAPGFAGRTAGDLARDRDFHDIAEAVARRTQG